MYKIYIWFKVLVNRLLGNISPIKKELVFVLNNFTTMDMAALKSKGVVYKMDLLGKAQWDWQFSADQLVNRGGGDCNSIMRAFQVFYYLKGWNAYLVTVITDDPAKHHATCIIQKGEQYRLIDYDDNIECADYCDCINTVQKKYNIHQVISITSQDINWKVRKI